MNWKKQRLYFLLLINSVIFFMTTTICWGFDATVIKNPDIIEVEAGADAIALAIQTVGANLKVHWEIIGPGVLLGDSSSLALFYRPPNRIDTESEDVFINVRVENESGEVIARQIHFKIISADQTNFDSYGIVVNPYEEIEVPIGGEPITLRVKVRLTNSQFLWQLIGEGELIGDRTMPVIFYRPPSAITGNFARATVVVYVTGDDGEARDEGILLKIVSHTKTTPVKTLIVDLTPNSYNYFDELVASPSHPVASGYKSRLSVSERKT